MSTFSSKEIPTLKHTDLLFFFLVLFAFIKLLQKFLH